MNKIYHICFPENKVPQTLANRFTSTNKQMSDLGIKMSLKYRKFPTWNIKTSYLVLFFENGQAYFSRIADRFVDAFYFPDDKEMVECETFEQFEKIVKEFSQNGYVIETLKRDG